MKKRWLRGMSYAEFLLSYGRVRRVHVDLDFIGGMLTEPVAIGALMIAIGGMDKGNLVKVQDCWFHMAPAHRSRMARRLAEIGVVKITGRGEIMVSPLVAWWGGVGRREELWNAYEAKARDARVPVRRGDAKKEPEGGCCIPEGDMDDKALASASVLPSER